MTEEFEKDIPDEITDEEDITLIELEGVRYEIIDTVNRDGKTYIAISPFDDLIESEDEDGDFTILEVSDDPEDEEGCILKTIDDEDLYSEIGELFIEKFAEDE